MPWCKLLLLHDGHFCRKIRVDTGCSVNSRDVLFDVLETRFQQIIVDLLGTLTISPAMPNLISPVFWFNFMGTVPSIVV